MQRLTIEQAEKLWQEDNLFTLGQMAHETRLKMHPDNRVTYIVDRNINYTNVCVSACKFCAFFKPPGHEDGYVLSFAELSRKISETLELGGGQILLQGGMNPDLDLIYYQKMLEFIKDRFPQIAVHGFSPPEIYHLSRESGLSVKEVVARLKKSGLDSIPGGGAEILVDRVRTELSPRKCMTAQWLEVMKEAHLQGLKTTATMMFGHVETIAERLSHLDKLRSLQDQTGGFTAFIPWTFQPGNTLIEVQESSSAEYLKFLALCRLFLDNIPNIQASWVTQGAKIGQMALLSGANDFGSTMIEENVVAAAGVCFKMPENELRSLIRGAGFEPRKRRMDYTLVE
ncbi:cyclic dehypoxanthinyl futalosine synthase [Desulfonatronovibrio magnus]|uniref:cyclic dehypoxanthinyl futalosine synthase n=1 Tax=Desulfonatronovibrio magnus TaxID=698827 RepID=UPI0005EB2F56|nr:cyclic dehypoxanthinyl futalosine synthase [Desulfonatronovibrio magnus]